MDELIPQDNTPPAGEFLLYTSADGKVKLDIRLQDETLWMTQQMMAELFQTSVHNIIQHVGNIYEDGELQREGTCKDFLQVRQEGKRKVKRSLTFYNLDMVISVGYRVNSVEAISSPDGYRLVWEIMEKGGLVSSMPAGISRSAGAEEAAWFKKANTPGSPEFEALRNTSDRKAFKELNDRYNRIQYEQALRNM